jgi:hypothetical protein
MDPSTSLWSFHLTPDSKVSGFKLGALSVYWKIREGDWILGMNRGEAEDEISAFSWLEGDAPESTNWRRAGSVEDLPFLEALPAFPNRPVVVRPEFSYTILPGERVHIFVGVPLSITIRDPKGLVLFEEPIYPLSNTWFGSPTDGELCYAMRTLAKREGENLDFGPSRIICPVRIRNQSKEKLIFERLCLRVQFLNIYESEGKGLWANESSVIVRSDEAWSRVAYARKAPVILKKPKLLVHGKEDAKGTHLLRALTEGKGFFE